MNIELCEGKYTLTDRNGRLEALRYGEPWRDLTGDNLVFCLGHRIEDLESRKEPWASVMTVATNRAIRKFHENGPRTQGVMSCITGGPSEGYNVQVTGLVTGEVITYPLRDLGIDPQDLVAP